MCLPFKSVYFSLAHLQSDSNSTPGMSHQKIHVIRFLRLISHWWGKKRPPLPCPVSVQALTCHRSNNIPKPLSVLVQWEDRKKTGSKKWKTPISKGVLAPCTFSDHTFDNFNDILLSLCIHLRLQHIQSVSCTATDTIPLAKPSGVFFFISSIICSYITCLVCPFKALRSGGSQFGFCPSVIKDIVLTMR